MANNVRWGKAVRKAKKARVLMEGPTGSGKTKSALLLAKGIVGDSGKHIFFIDTERESASLYSNDVPFITAQLTPPYSPERYIEYINSVPSDQCGCLIIDSITHEWKGEGGCLQIIDKMSGNKFANWNVLGERHQRFIEAILNAPFHVICCCRSKMAHAQEEENGKKVVKKLGMEMEQRDGFDYEVDLVFTIDQRSHYAVASKNRTTLWNDGSPILITPAEGELLREWLETEDADPNKTFAYDLISKACKVTSLDELGALYTANKEGIKVCSMSKEINAKFVELKAMFGINEGRKGLMVA